MFAAALTLPVATSAVAQAGPASLDERVARIERLLDSQTLVEMLRRLEALQKEVQELRGELEQQGHALDELRQRQRDLYLDTDRRLLQLERAQGPGAATPPAARTAPPQDDTPASPTAPGSGTLADPAEPAAPSRAVRDGAKEQAAYEQAFDLLRELRYEPAINAFAALVSNYPEGRYAHISQYWIAEANYAQRRFPQAIEAYQALLTNYPSSPKVADAKLKIGYCYHELGEWDKARATLTELTRTHPRTTEARQADNLLQRMRQEGR